MSELRPEAISKPIREKSPSARAVARVIRIGLHQDSFFKNRSPILQTEHDSTEENCPGLLELKHETEHPDHLRKIERVTDHGVWPPGHELTGFRHDRK